MGRSLSLILRQELENLDKDADSRKSAMKALKSYVKDLDSKAIPLFLAKVSETKETGSSPGEYAISLYEVLARVHGPKIVSQIDNIMTTIISTLTSSAGSFALHQACSKVVPAIARYGMDPSIPEERKRLIIHSLCKPLSNSLLCSQESLSSGSALCLNALVDSDNWRFASSEMVNEVCQRVAWALEKPAPANSHMGLVMALAKHNSLIVEAYARLLIRSGLQILNAGVTEGNSQKRLSAIQLVNFLMKCLDPQSIFSELGLVIEEMEKCQSDQMAYVRGAAFEALQTARRIDIDIASKFDQDMGSSKGSNFTKRDYSGRRNLWGSAEHSPVAASPESQTVDSFAGYDSFIESPISSCQVSGEFSYDRSVNRKLGRQYESGGMDVYLKNGLYCKVTRGSAIEKSECDDIFIDEGDYTNGFAVFLPGSRRNGVSRSTSPSHQRSSSQINVDNIKILASPRKLIRPLQDPNDERTDFSGDPTRMSRSPSSKTFEGSPASKYYQNGLSHNINSEEQKDEKLPTDSEKLQVGSESVFSSEDTPTAAYFQVPEKVSPGSKVESPCFEIQKTNCKSPTKVVCSLFVLLFALFICSLGIIDQDNGSDLVPT